MCHQDTRPSRIIAAARQARMPDVASLDRADWCAFWSNLNWSFADDLRCGDPSGGFGGTWTKLALFRFLSWHRDLAAFDPVLRSLAIDGTRAFLAECVKLPAEEHLRSLVESCGGFCAGVPGGVAAEEELRSLLLEAGRRLGWPAPALQAVLDTPARVC